MGEEEECSLLLSDHCELCVVLFYGSLVGSQAHINQQIRRLRSCEGKYYNTILNLTTFVVSVSFPTTKTVDLIFKWIHVP